MIVETAEGGRWNRIVETSRLFMVIVYGYRRGTPLGGTPPLEEKDMEQRLDARLECEQTGARAEDTTFRSSAKERTGSFVVNKV
jgi:hypothetical protein